MLKIQISTAITTAKITPTPPQNPETKALLKMLFGEKPKKSQTDINQQSLDALIQRNRLTLETNMRLARLGDSLSGIDGTLMDWRGIRKVKNEVVECESCKPGKTCDDCKYPGC